MGGYTSIPFVSKKVVHLEPSKPTITTNDFEDIDDVLEKQDESIIKNELMRDVSPAKIVPYSDIPLPKETEPIIITSLTPIQEEIEEIVSFPPRIVKQLMINIPEDHHEEHQEEDQQKEERIPEFRNNFNSESHAVKKFNRRHRKHQS